MMYAYVTDGTVRRIADVPTGAPGWLPVFDALPTYDPATQHHTFDSYDITEHMVIRRYRVEPLPPSRAEFTAVVTELRGQNVPAPGEPWQRPTGYLDAYPLGYETTHDGKTWIATQDGAAGEPGVDDGWREKQEPGQTVEWVQPRAGEEYPVGALVTHLGHTWRNDYTGPNGWEPGATGAQWTDLGPAE